jgi:uncharacterized protein
MRLLRAASHQVVPWKNGKGITRLLQEWPTTDNWSRRISIATIDASAEFSRFCGVDRALCVLEGEGLELEIRSGSRRRTSNLRAFDCVQFAGEDTVSANLIGGPTQDLNFMTRRPHAPAAIDIITVLQTVAIADAYAVVVLRGPLQWGDHTLQLHDALLADADAGARCTIYAENTEQPALIAVLRVTCD